jgi:peroxiredoxin
MAEVGQLAPNFRSRDLDGNELSLVSLIKGQKALLIFYRGGWCPYCNEQLANITRDIERFRQTKTVIVAVSSEEVEKGKELLKKLNLPFKLLSDTRLEGIDTYGVRNNDIPDALKAKGITGMAKPSAFIIDKHGIIRYKYIGANAKDRPKNEEWLKILNTIAN